MTERRVRNLVRAFLRKRTGAIAVEAAYVLPVIIATVMMMMELANIGLTIDLGGTAFTRALATVRQTETYGMSTSDMESRVRETMTSASHGYLSDDNIVTVDVEHFDSLDAMGGGTAAVADSDAQMQAWRITVDIRKDYITPLPSLLSTDSSAFRYRYQQVLAYLPQDVNASQ